MDAKVIIKKEWQVCNFLVTFSNQSELNYKDNFFFYRARFESTSMRGEFMIINQWFKPLNHHAIPYIEISGGIHMSKMAIINITLVVHFSKSVEN